MGEDLDSYAVADFVPFTPEVYARLFERHNADWGVLPWALLALSLGAVWVARRGHGRLVGIWLGAVWGWIGWAFYLRLYTPLNWAGEYLAWACFGQAGVLVMLGLTGRLSESPSGWRAPVAHLGVAAAVAVPAIAGGAFQAIGHAPIPTAVFTVALALLVARPAWVTTLVPLVVCAFSAATAYVFDHALDLVLPALTAALTVAAIALDVTRFRARRTMD